MGKWINPDGSRVACRVFDCNDGVKASGLCGKHYQRRYQHGDEMYVYLEYDPCLIPACDSTRSQRKVHGFCPKHYKLLWRYGMTAPEMISLYAEPKCGNGACGSTMDLHIDHDHACCTAPPTCGSCTRGLLCAGCNKALGLLRDNGARVRGLVDYLER
jgi:hypothetical protein